MDELSFWLALLRVNGIGPSHFQKITEQFKSLESFFQLTAAQLRELGLNDKQSEAISGFYRGTQSQLLAGVRKDLDWLAQGDCHAVLTWADEDYPALLREIKGSPPVLFVHGDVSALSLPQIAIVGSRNCSRAGRKLAHEFSSHFSEQGFVTSSGLALGIDTAAHQGALIGRGKTVAVLAHGLDTIYPARNRALAMDIVENGALVSEFPIGVNPRPQYFPRRNRIISGLSLGVLVVEAALKSGSLITAHEAVDQGREVFAIPGSIHDPLAKGCHSLIRNGAKLVETALHVVEELAPLLGYVHQQSQVTEQTSLLDQYDKASSEAKLLATLEYDPISIDQMVGMTGMSVADISSTLVMLELDGVITQQPGGYCRI